MHQFLAGLARRRRTVLLTAALGVALALGGAGAAATAATTGHSGTSVTRVSAVTQDTAVVYTSGAWTTVASTSIYALGGQWLDVRFTAESACYGTSGWCAVRILIDGAEAEPVVGLDVAFSSVTDSGGSTGWASRSIERVKTATSSGVHSVVVQAASVGTSVSDRLDDYTLIAYVLTP